MTKERYEFAKKYNISMVGVIAPSNGQLDSDQEAFIEKGVLINSGEFNGMNFAEAFKANKHIPN
jgi:leucyl-tRNA synthetase